MNKTLTEAQINRRWVEILIETLSLEKPTTIGPNDASCFVNALRGILAAQQPEPRAEATDLNTPCAGCSTPRACQYDGCRIVDEARGARTQGSRT
ncbi:hypothetical protein [Burkholderia oklahomensis]|uniref:hypothetical protein n=1 Tax=Burkholderia oklahomensis TaxID=342113 RepID=UPI0005D865BB|nr:hypothetical protein [Burkholderia oklahomensis]AJX31808.1 hypothetical protein BG90_187 [Burkholderia oklahomensis C6786]MBI0360999.1 hypothetical protein [Burkholderia oklahomensis]SUW60377.1 Uncharacterised protein [Burkholderia oklahomensis]